MLDYVNMLPKLKDALKESRRQLAWHKEELEWFKQARNTCTTRSQFDRMDKLISERTKEIQSLELNVRGLETEIRKYSFAPATA